MISWNIPSLEHPPAPKAPSLMLWLIIMLIVGIIGFGFAIYLSTNELLPTSMSNVLLIIVFAIFPALSLFLIRLFIYSLASYRHQLFTDMLDDAHKEWRGWATKHLGMLTHTRLTQIDEERKENELLSLFSSNKENILKLNSLKSLYSWEKKEKVVQTLLAPIADYYHKYSLTEPIVFYWQTQQKEEIDWLPLIQEEATRLALQIELIKPLPHILLSEWLLALYEQPFEPKLYVILSFQLDNDHISEEATSLLLTPQTLYEHLHLPIKTKLLRPLSTNIDDFINALKTQCEFQLSGNQLNSVWHSGVTDKNKESCIENYVQQGIHCLSTQFYDVDAIFGKRGITRHSMALSLVSDSPKNQLVVHQDGDKLLLQQIII